MSLPKGVICLWYGPIVSIPPGWVICDGSNDTPDLRDRFLVGAGSTYAVDAVGGGVNHNHTFTSDGHSHTLDDGAGLEAGAVKLAETTVEVDTGTTDNTAVLPPYHALAWIMKT